jgi:hypothetical protein
MTSLKSFAFLAFIASLFTRKNFAQAFSIFTVLGLVGTLFLVAPEVSATPADVSTAVNSFQTDVVALLKNILTAVIAIGSAAIVIFIANTALRWLRAAA